MKTRFIAITTARDHAVHVVVMKEMGEIVIVPDLALVLVVEEAVEQGAVLV
jgi:hypothetical protein